jgi:tetratricopeptide (TPR) repeat protein
MEADFIRIATDLINRKQWQDAKLLLTHALSSKSPDWAPIQESGGEEVVHCWNREEFVAYCEQAARTESGKIIWVSRSYSQACCLLAYVAVEQGNLQEAFEVLCNGLEMEPDHPQLWCELGYIFQSVKRHEDALGCYRRAEDARTWATHTQKAQALRGQGINLIDLGRLEEAEQALHRSLEFAPENSGALHELGFIQHLRQNTGVPPKPS